MELLKLAFSQECGRTYGPVEVVQTCDSAIYVRSQLTEGSNA